ncbi:MAG TPA: biosynthetic peptidoglycan transglycosylase [Gemmatimonadales bacterium]|nr:biosynthetic peptidoglycan transglycosylase [Gemmatimonadales bacterium]
MTARPRPGRRWWRWLPLLPALFLLWLFALWPPPAWYRTHFPAETAFMRMRRADAPLFSRVERRYEPVPLDRVASVMALAAITGEDANFWEHGGIDYESMRKALGYRRAAFEWDDTRDRQELRRALGRAWERRRKLRGASTITQQLAKNLYLSPSRNPLRKVKEAVTAYRLERALGKRRILELYLNVAEMGDEVWGVEAASRLYFRKPAAKLSRYEAAALAGLLPFPLRSNPVKKPGRMKWRQNLIMRRMAGERIEIPPDDAVVPAGVDLDNLFKRDSE